MSLKSTSRMSPSVPRISLHMTGFEFIFRRRVPSIAMKNGHAGQMNQVKGCVSRGFNHATFDHLFLASRV